MSRGLGDVYKRQPQEISSPDVEMGLTEPVEKAIPEAMDIILKEIGVK